MMNFKSTFVLALSFLAIYASPVRAQGVVVADTSRAHPITYVKSGSRFFIDGRQISEDSCKQLLKAFPSSAAELKKALRFEKRSNRALPFMWASVFPAGGFALVDDAQHYGTPWVHTTAIALTFFFIGDLVYISILDAHTRKHFQLAIDLYNAEIKRG